MSEAEAGKKAAEYLWDQILEVSRQHEWSTFVDPEYDPSDDRLRFRDGLSRAGWTDSQIQSFELRRQLSGWSAPKTSPGVSGDAEFILERTRLVLMEGVAGKDIERARLAHFAVEPKAGPFVSTVNVPLTDEVIITMGAHFSRYSALVARAFVRTNLAAVELGAGNLDRRVVLDALKRHPDIIFYWLRILMSYTISGTNVYVPFKPSQPHEVLLMEQVVFSMEIFALAHELGHHCLAHGRQLTDRCSARAEELLADNFAAKVCERAEKTFAFRQAQGHNFPNPYLWTSAGGLLLLGANHLFRQLKAKIFPEGPRDTHPDFRVRADSLMRRKLVKSAKNKMRLDFCGHVVDVVDCVAEVLQPFFDVVSLDGLRPEYPRDWEEESFVNRVSFR